MDEKNLTAVSRLTQALDARGCVLDEGVREDLAAVCAAIPGEFLALVDVERIEAWFES